MDDPTHTIQLALEPDSELATEDLLPFDTASIRKCVITSRFDYQRFGKFKSTNACLLVINFDFVPYYGLSFKYVELTVRVLKADKAAQPSKSPSIISYEPKRWQGERKMKKIQDNINATGSVAQAGFSAGKGRQSEYERAGRASVESILAASNVEWRLTENAIAEEGVPNPFQSALLINHDGPFALRLSFSVKLSKTTNPASWRGAYARMAQPQIIDPADKASERGKDLDKLHELDHEDFSLGDLIIKNWDV